MQIIFEKKRKKKKKKEEDPQVMSNRSNVQLKWYNLARYDKILFLSTKKKNTNVRLDDEECEKGHLSLVPNRVFFSRRLKLKFYGGYDRNHWRVNRVKLVLYDVTIATFYKASWGP